MCLILLEGCKQAQPNSSTSRGSKSSIILFSQSINNPIISVAKPGNIKRNAPKAIAAPEIIS